MVIKTIRILIPSKIAKRLRNAAKLLYGDKKDAVNQAINQSIDEWLLKVKLGIKF